MESSQVKRILYDDIDKLVIVLESIGCHHIKVLNNRIQCARPNGKNPTSIQVLTDDTRLATVIHTDNLFKGKDIISLVEYYMDIEFTEAIKYICQTIGVTYNTSYKPKKKLFSALDLFYSSTQEEKENDIIRDSALCEFIISPHSLLTEQGVSLEAQVEFETGYDIQDQRLLTPIRDRDGNLVSIKGRTIVDNHKEVGISKFLAYHKYNATQILYGLHKNELNILMENEVIVVEGEKSVQQLYSIDVKNAVSISKKKISTQQEKMLLELQVKIVIALDKDVSAEEVIQEANKFDGFAKVEIIWDWDDLLSDNDSPSDHGSFVWACLYESRVTLDEFKRRTVNCIRNDELV